MDTNSCAFPPPLTDDQLSQVLDEAAEGEILEHLEGCSLCRARLERLRRFDRALSGKLRRFDCPTAQTLANYSLSLLEPAEAEEIAQHLTYCVRCQQELTMLEAFTNINAATPAAPRSVIYPPRNVWQATVTSTTGNLALRGLDDKLTQAAHAQSATVYLETQKVTQGVILTGQVIDTAVDWRDAIIEIRQAGEIRAVQTLDEFCEFQFEAVDTSPVNLYITSAGGIVLAVEGLSLIN